MLKLSAGGAVAVESTTTVVPSSGPQLSTSLVVTTQGPPGPPGPAGSGAYQYAQASPASTWTITHALGRYPTSVLVVIGGELVDTDIDLPDTSTIVLTFASPQTGSVEYS